MPVEEAVALQRRLAGHVRRENGFDPAQVRTIAGVDASYRDDVARAVVVTLSWPELEIVERASAERAHPFPYTPGLLSFREGPAAVAAVEQLRVRPDILMFDGQGVAHPRGLGIASHLGLALGLPSIGCAKSRLVGTHAEPGPNRGDTAPLMHGAEQIGAVLRSKPRTNPLFVSIGHLIDLPTALAFVVGSLRGYRLPEPTRLADKLAGRGGPS